MNLLLISLDSLRLDYVSRTHPGVHTPRFDAAAADFLFADRCFSVASATRPVHLSLLSGLYPFEHGIEGQRWGRQRQGIPLLFRTLSTAGYAVAAYSEAATVFTGLDLGAPLTPLPMAPEDGLGRIVPWLRPANNEHTCVFAHYWEAHTPYGAADGLAMGETLELLRAGRLDQVQERYAGAVVRLLERKIAPLIEACDLARWCVLVVSDHGESWDAAEPYHGETLRNPVLRVPLYLHVPYSGNSPFPCPLMSLVDVYPTLCGILGLVPDGPVSGRDWRQPADSPQYLAQIAPAGAGPAGAVPGLAGPGTFEDAAPPAPAPAPKGSPRRWAAFDREWKYRWEEGDEGILEETLSGVSAAMAHDDPRVARLQEHWRRMRHASPYTQAPLSGLREADQGLLDQRLRDLGYLR